MNATPRTASADAAIDRLARRRVGARLGWLSHATLYLLVVGGLTTLAVWQGRHLPVAVALGWGLGVAIHGVRLLVAGAGSRLRERMVEAERQRLNGRPHA